MCMLFLYSHYCRQCAQLVLCRGNNSRGPYLLQQPRGGYVRLVEGRPSQLGLYTKAYNLIGLDGDPTRS